jgi:hypothetical protein
MEAAFVDMLAVFVPALESISSDQHVIDIEETSMKRVL